MEQSRLIHSGFMIQARSRPDALAISAAGRRLSYGELDKASARLAARIHPGVGRPREVVAILADRRPEMVVAVLACARAGRPFVVLDLAYPDERLEQLAAICRPSLALLAGGRAGEVAKRLGLSALAPEMTPRAGETLPDVVISPDTAAYLLFTSGSTGTPKCVACSHRPLVHFVDWQVRTFELDRRDRFALLSGLSHDPVLRDIFTPLSLGASIHIPDQKILTGPGELHAWFMAERPTVAHMTPPLGRLLTAARRDSARLEHLRLVFWGGDVLRYDLVDALVGLAPSAESVNFYGATETPQAICYFRARPGAGDDRVPIGSPVEGFEIEIRASGGQATYPGQYGEIVVRSKLLTMGEVRGGRLPSGSANDRTGFHATGDIGAWAADGTLQLFGRRDDQVKVRGYRVELMEVTAAALKAPELAQAITLNVGTAENVRLHCFVEPKDGAPAVDASELRSRLSRILPAYAVPHQVVVMDRLPLLPNGKLDRQALLAALDRNDVAGPAVPPPGPANTTQATLIEDWRRIFPGAQVGPDSSFASLSGDSLSYVTACLAVEQALGTVPENWTTLTIGELAGLGVKPKRDHVAEVETAIVLRALAIAAVVASHFHLIATGSAATSALIWVSGAIFGRLQLQESRLGAGAGPIARLLKSLLLPLLVIEGPQVLVKFLTHHHAQMSSMLLYADLIDYTRLPTTGPDAYGGHEYLMWYIHCLLHILMIFGLLIFVTARVLKLKRPVEATLACALVLGVCGRFLLPALLVPGFLARPIDPLSIFNHSPTAHLATFALAACSALVRGRTRFILLAVAAAYAALGARTYGFADSVSIAATAALLLFAPKLTLPRILARPLYLTAGASFFIYLLHFKALALASHLPVAPMAAVWALALGLGVTAWTAWRFAVQKLDGPSFRLRSRMRRRAHSSPAVQFG